MIKEICKHLRFCHAQHAGLALIITLTLDHVPKACQEKDTTDLKEEKTVLEVFAKAIWIKTYLSCHRFL